VLFYGFLQKKLQKSPFYSGFLIKKPELFFDSFRLNDSPVREGTPMPRQLSLFFCGNFYKLPAKYSNDEKNVIKYLSTVSGYK